MLGNSWLLKCIALLMTTLFVGSATAEQCTKIFPGGIQSHSPSGNIQMGYMSRVYGSGPMLTAPAVAHTHSWQDQVGLCDGVKCTASGTRASTQDVDFLTGTEVPVVFELSTSNNNVSNGYNAGTLALPAADYGTVSIGQESTVRFTTVDGTYRTKSITTHYKSVIEFQPGIYWVNGNLDWTAQDTRIRRLNGSNGRVTLYVSGNVNISQLHFEGFSDGQIRIYAKGNVTAGNDFIFPGEIHASGRVGFGERAKITGGIYSGNFSTGNGAVVRYTRQNHDHKMGALNPAYNSAFELTPGNYWVDGGFDASVASKFRKVGGSGVVRIFVRGNINVQHNASFEGFAGGDLVMYSTGNITLTSQTDLPAFVYAVGDVTINFSNSARYKGGITGRNVFIGQNSIVEYLDPVDLGPLCDDQPSVTAVDHYELSYSPTALTCQTVPVTISAYDSQGNLATVPSTVTLSPLSAWQGSGILSFIGQGTAYLRRSPGTYELGVSSAEPQAINATLCVTANCKITLLASGFLVDVPDFISGDSVRMTIQAVKADEDDPQKCSPAFDSGTRTLSFWSSYEDPNEEVQVGNQSVSIDGATIGKTSETATPIDITFSQNATARLSSLTYPDAGEMALHVKYSGAEGSTEEDLTMLSLDGEGRFIVTPILKVKTPDAPECDPERFLIEGYGCEAFGAAGDGFGLEISAVNVQGNATPNFRHPNIGLSVSEVGDESYYPRDGDAPIVYPESYKHDFYNSISFEGDSGYPVPRVNDVGILKIKVTALDYIQVGNDVAGISDEWIRFTPAYLDIEQDIELTPSCSMAEYSYQDQPIYFDEGAQLQVIGKNRQGITTKNYDRGVFWRFGGLSAHRFFSSTGVNALDRKIQESDIDVECLATDDLTSCRAQRLSYDSTLAELSPDDEGDGLRRYSLDGSATYRRRAGEPDRDDAPFLAIIRLFIDGEDLSDQDNVSYSRGGGGTSADYYLSERIIGNRVYLGRVRTQNIIAPDIPPPPRVKMPLWLEQWSGSAFIPEDDQGCTTIRSAALDEEYKGNLQKVTVYSQFSSADQQQGVGIQAVNGTEDRFDGSALIEHLIESPVGTPFWLCQSHEPGLGGICGYVENEEGNSARAAAQVTFGIHKGPKPLIFRRELYR
ncbi:polymer-forming cytoskeletal protein [Stutzerimonas stutzeri]|uniref:polymer-forming cytoskeletal protein n=1 Tax=Stutzerimonas stutzeri TaxID=316 RepID=UPI001CFF1910|nr:polymer-forming cytoskeletal protein [Stutzerimonas stutzeri]